MPTIGFLGFGEAGSTIATGLRRAGYTDIVAYDIDSGSERVAGPAEELGVPLAQTPAELVASAQVLVSAVVCNAAETAAESITPHLGDGQWLLDINSVAPAVKRRIAERVEPTGAAYVDIAVMANVTSDFSKLPLLVAGPRAGEVEALLDAAQLRVTPVSETPGEAARIKMYRSLFVKGLEALSLEAMMASYPTGVHEQVLASFEESFGHYSFPELVKHLIERHAMHGERRANELHEVAACLQEVGVDSTMADAGYERMSWDVRRGLKERLDEPEPDWLVVLAALEELRTGG